MLAALHYTLLHLFILTLMTSLPPAFVGFFGFFLGSPLALLGLTIYLFVHLVLALMRQD